MDFETDVLVIGGGVAGCATALYLAREGVEVVVIDRADVNGQASGANAGSIHSQMSFNSFNDQTPEWIEAYLPVLPLLKLSIEVWKELADELDDDIELVTEGGLMMAESEDQIALLGRKVAMENSRGVESSIIGRDEVLRLAPYVSDSVVGAEFCPNEGKINPLLATVAIARAAESAGARIRRFTELDALTPGKNGFEATTNQGRIRCARVVIAAGGWCDSVGDLLGITLPAGGRPIQMNATEATEHKVNHLVYTAGRKLTFKQAKAGNLIIGGGWPATLNPLTGLPAVVRETLQANLWTAMQVVPDVAHLRLIRTWAGTVNETPDGRPVLGPVPGVPGLFVNTFPGMGYTAGPCCSRILAEAMCGKNLSFDIAIGAIDRFAKTDHA
ncbi:MAG: FAD-binding oxidoreductase [Rhodospirillales bacterium]|jgi:glycine/D-amino acid oxidase-like deaminating enzyme|nr:FAD-binding oxidoreductase [Rhodospirillales bacterium]